MSNTDKIIKILRYGEEALTQAAEKGSYIHDPYANPISEIGYDPGEPYDEPQIHSIFEMAGAESKPIKRNGYIVGFEVSQPDSDKLKDTKDLLSFTENMIQLANEHGAISYRQNEHTTVDITDLKNLKFVTDTLYRAGFNSSTIRTNGKLEGFTAYDPNRAVAKETSQENIKEKNMIIEDITGNNPQKWYNEIMSGMAGTELHPNKETSQGIEIVAHTDDILEKLSKTDVYAIVKDPTKYESKIYWDVRNSKPNNDEKVIQQAESWDRTVVKIIDNGKPTLPNVTIDQLIDIPLTSRAERIVPPIVMETYRTVQNGHGLDETLLEQSVRDLTNTKELQQ